MAKQDYLPKEIDDLDTWAEKWLAKIPTVITDLSLPATHADEVKEKLATQRSSFAEWKIKKDEAKSFSNVFKAARKAAEDALRPYNQNLKTTSGYTDSIGDKIGIEGAEETIDPSTAKPKVKGSYEGGEGLLKFSHHKAMKSVEIISRRAAETSFTYLANDTNTPYNDSRPNLDPTKPEKREYILQFKDKDGKLIGQPSDTITITFPAE